MGTSCSVASQQQKLDGPTPLLDSLRRGRWGESGTGGAKGETAPWCMGIVMVCGGWNWRSPGLAGWSALVSKDQVMVTTVRGRATWLNGRTGTV